MSQSTTAAGACLIGVDTGGTFTDVTLLDPATGRLWTAKTASTPDDPSVGFGAGIAEVSARAGADGSRSRVEIAADARRPHRHQG